MLCPCYNGSLTLRPPKADVLTGNHPCPGMQPSNIIRLTVIPLLWSERIDREETKRSQVVRVAVLHHHHHHNHHCPSKTVNRFRHDMPLTLDFTNKLVLITGGGRGIGWAITNSLAKGESNCRCEGDPFLIGRRGRQLICLGQVLSTDVQPERMWLSRTHRLIPPKRLRSCLPRPRPKCRLSNARSHPVPRWTAHWRL